MGFDQMAGFDANPLGREQAGRDSMTTDQMREELIEAGEGPLGEKELVRLSKLFNDKLRRLMEKENRDKKHIGWYTLFKEVGC